MEVTATPELVEAVRAAGGVLYVRADRGHCCGGTAWLRASTAKPAAGPSFREVPAGPITLQVSFPATSEPELLHLYLKGGRRLEPAASWDGCAYVV